MKNYKVKLYVGKTFVGEYFVSANNKEQARELAWEIAEIGFNADEEEIENE